MKRVALIAFVIVSLFVASPLTVGASDEWCDADPVMLIVTPHGALVPVFVNTGAQGVLTTPAVLLATLSYTYTAKPASGGTGTNVDVTVVVPPGLLLIPQSFSTRTVVSTGPFGTGEVYGRAQGTSGQAMHVSFQLPVA